MLKKNNIFPAGAPVGAQRFQPEPVPRRGAAYDLTITGRIVPSRNIIALSENVYYIIGNLSFITLSVNFYYIIGMYYIIG